MLCEYTKEIQSNIQHFPNIFDYSIYLKQNANLVSWIGFIKTHKVKYMLLFMEFQDFFLIHSSFAYICSLISGIDCTTWSSPWGGRSQVFQASVVSPICQEKPLLEVKGRSSLKPPLTHPGRLYDSFLTHPYSILGKSLHFNNFHMDCNSQHFFFCTRL